MKRLGKNTAWSVGLLSMLLLASACSNDNNAQNANATPSASSSASATTSASPESSPSASPDPSASASDSPSASPSASASASNEQKKIAGSGKFNGQVDNHSIEVNFNGEPTVFQITPEISDQISDWDEGIPIKFEYTESNIDSGGQTLKQYTIVTIEKQ